MQQSFAAQALSITGAQTAVATSVTETGLHPSLVVGSGYLRQGQTFRLTACGVYGTTGTPTLQFHVRFGTNGTGGTVGNDTSLASTSVFTTGSGVTTQLWMLDALLTVYALGASGSIQVNGEVVLFTGVSAISTLALAQVGTAPAAQTVATTSTGFANSFLTLTALWGTSSASNTIQLLNLHVLDCN